MDSLKTIQQFKYPIPFSKHFRGKSDLLKNKENLHLASSKVLSSIRNTVHGIKNASIILRNPSIRSRSINLNEKNKLDLGKLVVTRTLKQNFTARNLENEKKELLPQRKSSERIIIACNTDRITKKEITPTFHSDRSNPGIFKSNLQLAPSVTMLNTNKFFEKYLSTQHKLDLFYS